MRERSGSSGSGDVATILQYDSTWDRDAHIGKTVSFVNSTHVSSGINCLPLRFVEGSDVDEGSKGELTDGVIRLLRFVPIVSSSCARERRRKSRR